jgi:hypothetical protein
MAIVVGLDVHRSQITYDALNSATGEVTTGRIAPAVRATLRRFLRRWSGEQVEAAVEATTGWRFVVEELQRAGAAVQLAEPADTTAARTPDQAIELPGRASSDRFEHGHDRFGRRHRGDLVGHSARLHSEAAVVEEPADRVSDARGVHFLGTDHEPRSGASYGRSVEELVGGLGQAELWDAQRERGKHSSGPGVGGHYVAGGEKQRLRDVTLDDDARRLGTERCRITVRADGDDKPDAEVPDPR